MQHFGDHAFSRTGFSCNQHIGVDFRHLKHQFVNRGHGTAFGDKRVRFDLFHPHFLNLGAVLPHHFTQLIVFIVQVRYIRDVDRIKADHVFQFPILIKYRHTGGENLFIPFIRLEKGNLLPLFYNRARNRRTKNAVLFQLIDAFPDHIFFSDAKMFLIRVADPQHHTPGVGEGNIVFIVHNLEHNIHFIFMALRPAGAVLTYAIFRIHTATTFFSL